MNNFLKCPTCESPEPRLHPATQSEGEVVTLCLDPFHNSCAGDICQCPVNVEDGNR